MSYKVIEYFQDLQDKNHEYNAGDTFPRKGLKVSEERLAQLASKNNKRKRPVIEKVGEAEPVEEPAAEPVEEPVKEAKKPAKK